MKPEILLVDNDPEVRSVVHDALEPHRESWSLHVAAGSAEALEHLAANEVDVLLTDLGVPGPGGATLVDHVGSSYPGTARIVLAGDAPRDSIIAVTGAAQQFLAKPCRPAALIAALESVVTTRGLLADPHLRATLGGPENLPKPPAIYAELCVLANSPGASADDVARVVERDVGTAAELLKLVNSSFFGVVNEVSSISRAVTLLGLDVIQALVVAGQVFRATGQLPPGLDAAAVAGHGMKACVAVRRAGAVLGWDQKLIGQVSLAALLHDVGLLLLAAGDHAAWADYRARRTTLPARDAETQAFGCTIGRASAYILGLWGFHPTVVSALAEQPVALDDDAARAGVSLAGLIVAEAHAAAAPVVGESAA